MRPLHWDQLAPKNRIASRKPTWSSPSTLYSAIIFGTSISTIIQKIWAYACVCWDMHVFVIPKIKFEAHHRDLLIVKWAGTAVHIRFSKSPKAKFS